MKPSRGHIGKRDRNNKKRNPIILYAAEGDNKTEKIYLDNFKKKGRTIVKASGNATDPVNIMAQLKRSAKELQLSTENGDRAFCIIDADTDHEKQAKIDLICSKQDKLFHVIMSAPCFEEWLLCHYRFSTGYQTSTDAFRELKEICPEYEKSYNIYPKICDDTYKAIENAKSLQKFHNNDNREEHSIERNPSSDMYKIVEFLLEN